MKQETGMTEKKEDGKERQKVRTGGGGLGRRYKGRAESRKCRKRDGRESAGVKEAWGKSAIGADFCES